MLRTKQVCWALVAAVGLAAGVVGAPSARAQTGSQPSAEGYALYDRLVGPLAARSGVPSPEAAETPALGCQRYGQIAPSIIRFAVSSSLAPGLTLDSPRAESHRQAADLMIEDAQAALDQLASAGATVEQCAAAARSFGAAAFSLARTINRANVERNAQVVVDAQPKPTGPDKSAEELAAEEAAKAEVVRMAREEEEARQRATDLAEHAFAHLGSVKPVPTRSQAAPLAFNAYLIDTPAMHTVKDFRMCFEPGLYQLAAKPVVDLASAALEVPEVAPLIGQTVDDFLAKLRATLAKRLAFPADRLTLDIGEAGPSRGPVVEPIKAVSEGCHVYLASRTPPLTREDPGTTFGLMAENIVEDVVTRPALEVRLTALPILERALKGDMPPPPKPDPLAVVASATEPGDPNAAPPAAAPPPPTDAMRCARDARCHAAVTLAVNACMQAAERRIGKAAIAREIEARGPISAALRKDAYDAAANRDFDLISGNMELIDRTLMQTLDRLADDGKRLRGEAGAYLTNLEVDAVLSAGRNEGEQGMGAPVLQCYSRMADGRGLDLAPQ